MSRRRPFTLTPRQRRALARVRDGISRYNAAHGSDGYHDTITVACVVLVHSRMRPAGSGEDFDGFFISDPAGVIHLVVGDEE